MKKTSLYGTVPSCREHLYSPSRPVPSSIFPLQNIPNQHRPAPCRIWLAWKSLDYFPAWWPVAPGRQAEYPPSSDRHWKFVLICANWWRKEEECVIISIGLKSCRKKIKWRPDKNHYLCWPRDCSRITEKTAPQQQSEAAHYQQWTLHWLICSGMTSSFCVPTCSTRDSPGILVSDIPKGNLVNMTSYMMMEEVGSQQFESRFSAWFFIWNPAITGDHS